MSGRDLTICVTFALAWGPDEGVIATDVATGADVPLTLAEERRADQLLYAAAIREGD